MAYVRKTIDRWDVISGFIRNTDNGKIVYLNTEQYRDAGLEADKKEWLFDCFFKSNCGKSDIIEAANLIFNMLCNAPMSKIIRGIHKQRVQNTYNDGWHFETVYQPERMGNVDF